MDDLIEHARSVGLAGVEFDDSRDLGGRIGYTREDGYVVLNARMPYMYQCICVLHECGHWVYGHVHTADTPEAWRLRDERQADQYAASHLITADQYAAAERVVGPDPLQLSTELDVTPRIVMAWQDAYRARPATGGIRALRL